jgi:methionine-rich copper-binding protein CopC
MLRQVLMFVGLTAACGVPLSAHAILLAASPAADQTVRGTRIDVQLRFNCRIDAGRSRLILIFPDKSTRPVPVSPQATPSILKSQIPALPAGEYRLQWQVLAADGHITRGEIPFHVH